MGVAPTHRKVQFSGIDILRISGGRVVEHWGETNGLEVMHQIQEPPGAQDASLPNRRPGPTRVRGRLVRRPRCVGPAVPQETRK